MSEKAELSHLLGQDMKPSNTNFDETGVVVSHIELYSTQKTRSVQSGLPDYSKASQPQERENNPRRILSIMTDQLMLQKDDSEAVWSNETSSVASSRKEIDKKSVKSDKASQKHSPTSSVYSTSYMSSYLPATFVAFPETPAPKKSREELFKTTIGHMRQRAFHRWFFGAENRKIDKGSIFNMGDVVDRHWSRIRCLIWYIFTTLFLFLSWTMRSLYLSYDWSNSNLGVFLPLTMHSGVYWTYFFGFMIGHALVALFILFPFGALIGSLMETAEYVLVCCFPAKGTTLPGKTPDPEKDEIPATDGDWVTTRLLSSKYLVAYYSWINSVCRTFAWTAILIYIFESLTMGPFSIVRLFKYIGAGIVGEEINSVGVEISGAHQFVWFWICCIYSICIFTLFTLFFMVEVFPSLFRSLYTMFNFVSGSLKMSGYKVTKIEKQNLGEIRDKLCADLTFPPTCWTADGDLKNCALVVCEKKITSRKIKKDIEKTFKSEEAKTLMLNLAESQKGEELDNFRAGASKNFWELDYRPYNLCWYLGQVDEFGRPSGFGRWCEERDDGEILTGFWDEGIPKGPFESHLYNPCQRLGFSERIFGTGKPKPTNATNRRSTRMSCVNIGWVRVHFQKQGAEVGIAQVETCPTNSSWSHLPVVRNMFSCPMISSEGRGVDCYGCCWDFTTSDLRIGKKVDTLAVHPDSFHEEISIDMYNRKTSQKTETTEKKTQQFLTPGDLATKWMLAMLTPHRAGELFGTTSISRCITVAWKADTGVHIFSPDFGHINPGKDATLSLAPTKTKEIPKSTFGLNELEEMPGGKNQLGFNGWDIQGNFEVPNLEKGTTEVVIFIHGSQMPINKWCEIVGDISASARFPSHVKPVAFSWPSGNPDNVVRSAACCTANSNIADIPPYGATDDNATMPFDEARASTTCGWFWNSLSICCCAPCAVTCRAFCGGCGICSIRSAETVAKHKTSQKTLFVFLQTLKDQGVNKVHIVAEGLGGLIVCEALNELDNPEKGDIVVPTDTPNADFLKRFDPNFVEDKTKPKLDRMNEVLEISTISFVHPTIARKEFVALVRLFSSNSPI
eukprot:GHVP01069667.1.p1 GENE.GHVP01069667.1~~GHVP01069667.1.p1  ORF type:complete len:1074 (+),score=177.91 GHVP01069667.1:28-3249(+)